MNAPSLGDEEANALRAGDLGPARRLLRESGWLFAHDERLSQAFLLHLERFPPEPSSETDDPLAWALAQLATCGRILDQRGRVQWMRAPAPADARDAETAALWAGFARERYPARIQAAWEKAFLSHAAAAFLSEAEGTHQIHRLRKDLAEQFFLLCLGPKGETPVWRRIHARVVEQGPEGPVQALVNQLPAALQPRLARAMVEQGSRAESALLAFPFKGMELRARAARELAFGTPDGVERLLDFHLAVRLLSAWRSSRNTSEELSWSVITQNRGRARSRLRAVLADLPELPVVPEVGLYHRSRVAVMRFFRDLARDWRHRGYAMGQDTRVDPPCLLPEAPEETLPREQRQLLRAFVLRGLLLGHHETLGRWIPTGDGRGLTTFYRYLQQDLPPSIQVLVPIKEGGRRDYDHLRALLHGELNPMLAELRPLLLALSNCEPSAAQVRALVHPFWHPEVPPLTRLKTCITAAAQLARQLHPDPGGHEI